MRVHYYIPLEPDGSNAEEMVQWVIDNDQAAKHIAERAILFMHGLLQYHPKTEVEEIEVQCKGGISSGISGMVVMMKLSAAFKTMQASHQPTH